MAIVSYTLEELKKMPSLTDWERVLNMKDEDIVIDEDNPEWTDEMFARATRGGVPLMQEEPQRVSIYLRPSLLARYRGKGKNWRKQLSNNFETWLLQNQGVAL